MVYSDPPPCLADDTERPDPAEPMVRMYAESFRQRRIRSGTVYARADLAEILSDLGPGELIEMLTSALSLLADTEDAK